MKLYTPRDFTNLIAAIQPLAFIMAHGPCSVRRFTSRVGYVRARSSHKRPAKRKAGAAGGRRPCALQGTCKPRAGLRVTRHLVSPFQSTSVGSVCSLSTGCVAITVKTSRDHETPASPQHVLPSCSVYAQHLWSLRRSSPRPSAAALAAVARQRPKKASSRA